MKGLFSRVFFSFLAAQVLLWGALFLTIHIGYARSQMLWEDEKNDLITAFARKVLLEGATENDGAPVSDPVFVFSAEKELVFSNRGGGRRRALDQSSLTPVLQSDRLIGYLSYTSPRFSDDSANTAFFGALRTVIALGLGFSFIAALLFSFIFSRSLARPARLLAVRLDRMAEGDLSSPVPASGPAEIASLARSAQRLGRELAEEKTARARFSSDIAHDLRTPLSALRAQLEGMRDGVLDHAPERFNRNLRELGRLEELTDSLAELMRLEDSGYTLGKEAIGLDELFRELGEAFEIGMQNKGIDFQAEPKELTIVADRRLIHRALSNLLFNAVRHADEGGEVRLAARRDGGRIILSVWNSGPPVPAAELPHVFDRLYRGEFARGTPGSGLGLTIARQIAELHGGEIIMTSAENKGTEVAITLPG